MKRYHLQLQLNKMVQLITFSSLIKKTLDSHNKTLAH